MNENIETPEASILETEENIADIPQASEEGSFLESSDELYDTIILMDKKLDNIEKINMGVFVGISLLIGVVLALVFANYLKH